MGIGVPRAEALLIGASRSSLSYTEGAVHHQKLGDYRDIVAFS